MKKIGILGSTGSIGTQTLTVVDWYSHLFKVEILTANTNIKLLSQQIEKYKPRFAVVLDHKSGQKLIKACKNSYTEIVLGMDGLMEVLDKADYQQLVTAVSGAIGLKPTMAAINKGVDIALANKETLVAAGEIVMELAKEKKVKIIPVDSEHSAIFQCLNGEKISEVHKVILTASGGPFKGYSFEQLAKITPEKALKHPKWNMGSKISIDSATLMNKGLEVIEAKWLFALELDKIEVVVHPQSIIHSMVQFADWSIIAQLGPTDMKIPIQYALTYPARLTTGIKPIDLTEIAQFNFEAPNNEVFPALDLAYQALKVGGTMPAVLNGANEIAVSLFLSNKISFLEIPCLVHQVMTNHKPIDKPSLEEILLADEEARLKAKQYVEQRVVK